MKQCICSIFLIFLFSCNNNPSKKVPTIGFVDAFQDNTIAKAKDGFFDALKKNGLTDSANTIKIIYKNANGDIPTLIQIIKYFINEDVSLIATNPSLPTITALQQTNTIPVFMMVSPTPTVMKLTDEKGNAPANLFGVADNQDYIDTSVALIPKLIGNNVGKLKVGVIYNQSEPQSVETLERIKRTCLLNNMELVYLPVNATADVQLVTQSLLNKGINAFFANPDNTVFASFESIVKACNDAKVPIFTSEAGLVARGAVAAYGADIYEWGYQAGEQAAKYLQATNKANFKWELVKVRKRIYNPSVAKQFNIAIPANYQAF